MGFPKNLSEKVKTSIALSRDIYNKIQKKIIPKIGKKIFLER
jgi:hypothetical protein